MQRDASSARLANGPAIRKTQADGAAQQVKGKVEKTWGNVKDAARNAQDEARNNNKDEEATFGMTKRPEILRQGRQ